MSLPCVAILGATGAVGNEFLRVLEQRHFPMRELRLLASPRSAGKQVLFRGKLHTVQAVTREAFAGVDIGLFSAGGSVSVQWAPIAAEQGALVIDNTSAFRMEADVPLVVPEVNGHMLDTRPARGIFANPNCGTIPLVHAMKPLHEQWGLQRLVVSTYQSVSGKGAAAMDELEAQSLAHLTGEGPLDPEQFPHPIAFNLLPHIDSFTDNGYTKEEMKVLNESRKIMSLPELHASATCVRVPVFRAHSLSVNATFASEVDAGRAREMLAAMRGIIVVDDPAKNEYPMPRYADGLDETFVGRIRKDISNPFGTGLDMWIVSDNLRKGAALNAVQIAEEWIARQS